MQRDFDSSLLFNALYLSISDILLTRLHVRAREERVTPINKGLNRVPFVLFSCPFVKFVRDKINKTIL